MKTLSEKIKEHSTMLSCIENVVDEISWRKKSAQESVDEYEIQIKEFREEHDGEENEFLIQRKEEQQYRIECFNKIEEALEKLI